MPLKWPYKGQGFISPGPRAQLPRQFRALRPIQRGEELLHSYLGREFLGPWEIWELGRGDHWDSWDYYFLDPGLGKHILTEIRLVGL